MALSNMMKHWFTIKEKYKDCIVFYRLGDFYEMFFEDAVNCYKILDLTLTGRDCGLEQRAPMCGVPFHAADSYISKLIENGYKVAICEQLSEPKPGKELVQRDVIRIVTPGIVMDENMLNKDKNNYIISIYIFKNDENMTVGVSYCDVSTGEFNTIQLEKGQLEDLEEILLRISASEIYCNKYAFNIIQNLSIFKLQNVGYIGQFDDDKYSNETVQNILTSQFGENCFNNFDFKKDSVASISACALISYLNETQKRKLSHINYLNTLNENMVMHLDLATRRNLELTETIKDHKKKGSLLSVLDNTTTCMGGRLFRNWLSAPLQDEKEINLRLDAVENLISNIIIREDIKRLLSKISDLERITGRISYGNFNPKDALSLRQTLQQLPELKELLQKFTAKKLVKFFEDFDDLADLRDLLDKTISEDAPVLLRDGNVIKNGFDKTLDEYRNARQMATTWLSELEAKEREATGIKNLRIAYNKVFGYFIEVNKSQVSNVPYRYIRKQTVANNERYITEELKTIEEKVESARENSLKLEIEIFTNIRNYLFENIKRIQKVGKIIAELDCLLSGAVSAVKYNYCKPKISSKINHIKIEAGRHPVVEAINKEEIFVPNDAFINSDTDKTLIITGPNMAGKSTFMRQIALIVLMAHVGLFVPATNAEISITDRIFTRIGASDDVAFGQSTFMVEMLEVANILNNATSKSLALLDEIGRGTSTFDGLSIAWAVIEHINEKMNMKTLFSTHYHELTELEGVLEGVKNYRITVKEYNDEIIFLRKIVRGGASKSFGIAVAKLANLPSSVIKRAKQISYNLEKADINKKIAESNLGENISYSLNQQANKNIIGIIKDVDVNKLTPLSAFEILVDLIEKVK